MVFMIIFLFYYTFLLVVMADSDPPSPVQQGYPLAQEIAGQARYDVSGVGSCTMVECLFTIKMLAS